MVEIVALVVLNTTTTTTGTITVQGGAATAVGIFTGTTEGVVVGAGGCFLWFTPEDGFVTVSTNNLLRLTGSVANATADVMVLGRSA